jgi:hypothetical protein
MSYLSSKEVATRIKTTLVEKPELWIKNSYGTKGGPQCLVGHIQSLDDEELMGPAYRSFSQIILRRYGTKKVSVWNDQPTTTLDDVISVLDEVINE